jgi:Zn-dependent protease/CBS domain-containing protein
MSWSFRIARVAGIDVKVHATFFLILLFYGWLYYQNGGLASAVGGVIFVLLLFFCVLLHEFGHAFAARAFGIRTPDITLLPIGGVARLERMPRNPVQELVIAVAGPAVNIVIALFLLPFVVFGNGGWNLLGFDQVEGGLAGKLLGLNLVLVLFNMIPAFPMDGGRVLRALLAIRLKHSRATLIAGRVGQGIAVLFAVGGFLGNPMMILIAMFVFTGAQQEIAMARYFDASRDSSVARFMTTKFDTLPADFSPSGLGPFLAERGQSLFPVVDPGMRVVGVADRARLLGIAGTYDGISSVTRTVPVLPTGLSTAQAISIMNTHREPILPVVNAGGQIVGLVSAAALGGQVS